MSPADTHPILRIQPLRNGKVKKITCKNGPSIINKHNLKNWWRTYLETLLENQRLEIIN